MSERTRLRSLAINVAQKVAPGSKDPHTPYVGLEHLATDRPEVVGMSPSNSSIGINAVFQAGDTLFGKLRPNLRKVAHANFRGYCSTDILVIRAHEDTDPHYLSHLLRSRDVLDFAVATAFGTKMPRTSWSLLASRDVFKPPMKEQRRIADILDTLDDQIRVTRGLLSKVKLEAEGLLSDFILTIIEGRRESLVKLCSADICYGIVQSGGYVANGVPVLAIRDLGGDFETGLNRTSRSIDAQYRRSRVASGDVLLSIKGTIGRVGIVPGHYTGNISRELARLRFSDRMRPDFARLYFMSREAQRRLDLSVVGTTRAEVSIHVLKQLSLPVPDLRDQERLVDAVGNVEHRMRTEQRSLDKLLDMRRGLADDLLTGRIRVPQDGAA